MVKSSRTKSRQLKDKRKQIGRHPLVTQMCLIHSDFKHFYASETKDFRLGRKLSSIMSEKPLSIMRMNAAAVTAD
jgi:hypothetical protein